MDAYENYNCKVRLPCFITTLSTWLQWLLLVIGFIGILLFAVNMGIIQNYEGGNFTIASQLPVFNVNAAALALSLFMLVLYVICLLAHYVEKYRYIILFLFVCVTIALISLSSVSLQYSIGWFNTSGFQQAVPIISIVNLVMYLLVLIILVMWFIKHESKVSELNPESK